MDKKQNILVTGGAGYIGSHIVEQLIKNKKKVIIIDNLVTGHKELINKKAKFFKLDVKNKLKVSKLIFAFKFLFFFKNKSIIKLET